MNDMRAIFHGMTAEEIAVATRNAFRLPGIAARIEELVGVAVLRRTRADRSRFDQDYKRVRKKVATPRAVARFVASTGMVREALRGGADGIASAAAMTGLGRDAVSGALKRLVAAGEVVRYQRVGNGAVRWVLRDG